MYIVQDVSNASVTVVVQQGVAIHSTSQQVDTHGNGLQINRDETGEIVSVAVFGVGGARIILAKPDGFWEAVEHMATYDIDGNLKENQI